MAGKGKGKGKSKAATAAAEAQAAGRTVEVFAHNGRFSFSAGETGEPAYVVDVGSADAFIDEHYMLSVPERGAFTASELVLSARSGFFGFRLLD